MKIKEAVSGALAILFATVLTLLPGCGLLNVEIQEYVGAPHYSATDPASVDILRTAPSRPHERLGEIAIEPSGKPPAEKIEQKLRRVAAKLGANAVVIVADRTGIMGPVATGTWYGGPAMPEYKGVVVAVAIRYRDQQ